MAEYDPYISNGTCYWQAGHEASSKFIPCGNEALGNVPCCEGSDKCISSLACYNPVGVTYLAGCTDPSYQDANCPDKGLYANQSWVGLSYCNGTSRQWVGCANPAPNPSNQDKATVTGVPPGDCYCPTTSAHVLFTDADHLADYVFLPSATGMTFQLGGGLSSNPYQSSAAAHVATTAAASTTDSSTTSAANSSSTSSTDTSSTSAMDISSTGPSTMTTTPTSTSTSAPTSPGTPTASHMSSGQIAGAAAGGAIGLLLLLTLFAALMQRYYRKKRKNDPSSQEKADRPDSKVYTDDILAGDQSHGGLLSPSYKSELPAESVSSPSMRSPMMKSPSTWFSEFGSVQSEMESSPVVGPAGRPDGGVELPGRKGTYYEMSA